MTSAKVVVNLTVGCEESERATIHFLARLSPGATPMWEWIGDAPSTVFSY